MNKPEEKDGTLARPHAPPAKIITDAALRRKFLFNGISKGSAVAAAVIPIKSLATERYVTADGKICSVSGTQSAAHSQATSYLQCVGGHPSYYLDPQGKPKNWPLPNNCKVGGKSFKPDTPCNYLFSGGPQKSLINCLKTEPNSDTSVMITAILNACKSIESSVIKSPYTAGELMERFHDSRRQSTLDFCRGYMQTRRS